MTCSLNALKDNNNDKTITSDLQQLRNTKTKQFDSTRNTALCFIAMVFTIAIFSN
jgi:hypothetical protein